MGQSPIGLVGLAAIALSAWLLAVLLTPVARRLALRFGAVDQPDSRRVHSSPTPSWGGLAILAAFLVPLLVAAAVTNTISVQIVGIAIGAVLISIMGAIDDLRGLPVAPRLGVQVGVALLAICFGVRFEGITSPFADAGYVNLGWLSWPATLLWIVFITNSVNWIDGLDGLAAGICAIASGALALMAAENIFATGAVASGMMGAAICGACLGFLPYNFSPAKIFMGDAGAMFLGFVLACTSTVGAFKIPTAVAVLPPALVLGVPIADMTTTILSRARNGRPIYKADRSHLHHRLLQAGLSVPQVVMVLYGAELALCLLAFLLFRG